MDVYDLYRLASMVLYLLMAAVVLQGILALALGNRRRENLAYRSLAGLTAPLMRLSRAVSPPFLAEIHVGVLVLFLLVALRLAVYVFFQAHGWPVSEGFVAG